jgi:hypothetical protein
VKEGEFDNRRIESEVGSSVSLQRVRASVSQSLSREKPISARVTAQEVHRKRDYGAFEKEEEESQRARGKKGERERRCPEQRVAAGASYCECDRCR